MCGCLFTLKELILRIALRRDSVQKNGRQVLEETTVYDSLFRLSHLDGGRLAKVS